MEWRQVIPPGMIPAGDSAEVRPAHAITEVPVGQPTDEKAGQVRAPGGTSTVRVPFLEHPIWRQLFPWLVQGVTGAGDSRPFDLALFGEARPRDVLERWGGARPCHRCDSGCTRSAGARGRDTVTR